MTSLEKRVRLPPPDESHSKASDLGGLPNHSNEKSHLACVTQTEVLDLSPKQNHLLLPPNVIKKSIKTKTYQTTSPKQFIHETRDSGVKKSV